MQKLTLSLIIMMLCAIIGVGWAIDQLFESYYENDAITSYKKLGKQIAGVVDSMENDKDFIREWNAYERNQLTLTNRSYFPIPEELKQSFELGNTLVLESEATLSLHFLLPMKQMVLTFIPEELSLSASSDTFNLLLTFFFYSGVIFFILIWIYPLIQRLHLLRKSAINFGKGKFSSRIELKSMSYISDIEIEFNRMANKIEMLISDNKLISSAVSHDLRTPLSRLRFGIDLLSDTHDPESRMKHQKHLSQDIDEMQSLVEVLLDYAKLENSLVTVPKNYVALESIIEDCVAHFNSDDHIIVIEKENHIIDYSIDGNIQYLGMLFSNLLSNAIEHSNSNILVELRSDQGRVVVNIHDDGDGVLESEIDDISKPFIRGGKSGQKKGYGMGLAIVERITHWHQGDLKILRSYKLHGAMFQVSFPKGRA